jgi:hypothetical protein
MAKKSRQRRADEQAPGRVRRLIGKVLIAVAIIAAFVAVYLLGVHTRSGRMDAFAKCLASKQAKMYGAFWCPHCADQKEMFGRSFQYVPYVECGIKGSRDEAAPCAQAGIKHFPTWQFADGVRQEGALSLRALGEKTGCGLP